MNRSVVISFSIHFGWLCLGWYLFSLPNDSSLLMTADSGYYATVAEALRSHRGFTHHGEYWTVFPPLYSLVLSLAGSDRTVIQFAPLLHAALFGTLLMIVSSVQNYQTPRMIVASLFFPLLILFSPIFGVSSYLWTEELFIILTGLLLMLLRLHPTKISWTWLIALGIVSSLAPITRYIGIVNIFTASIYLTLVFGGRWWQRIMKSAGFGLAASIPLTIWCYRNYQIDGTFFGTRPPSETTLYQNLLNSFFTFTEWFEIAIDGINFNVLWLVTPVILYAGMRIRSFILWKQYLPPFLYVGAYTVALNRSASTNWIDPIETRLLVPVYLPLVFSLCSLTQTIFTFGKKSTQLLIVAALMLLLIGNVFSFGKMCYNLPQHNHELICWYNYHYPPSVDCSSLSDSRFRTD